MLSGTMSAARRGVLGEEPPSLSAALQEARMKHDEVACGVCMEVKELTTMPCCGRVKRRANRLT